MNAYEGGYDIKWWLQNSKYITFLQKKCSKKRVGEAMQCRVRTRRIRSGLKISKMAEECKENMRRNASDS